MKNHKEKSMFLVAVLLCALAVSGAAQTSNDSTSVISASAISSVPRLVRYSGVARDMESKPLTGTAGVTFFLYKEKEGGAPLWLETQNVQLDSKGNYTVQLGATQPDGLPSEIFASAEARWLGVQISNQPEQPRVLLVAVPYALKAADADTLGGKPASLYVTTDSRPGASSRQSARQSSSQQAAAKTVAPRSAAVARPISSPSGPTARPWVTPVSLRTGRAATWDWEQPTQPPSWRSTPPPSEPLSLETLPGSVRPPSE